MHKTESVKALYLRYLAESWLRCSKSLQYAEQLLLNQPFKCILIPVTVVHELVYSFLFPVKFSFVEIILTCFICLRLLAIRVQLSKPTIIFNIVVWYHLFKQNVNVAATYWTPGLDQKGPIK